MTLVYFSHLKDTSSVIHICRTGLTEENIKKAGGQALINFKSSHRSFQKLQPTVAFCGVDHRQADTVLDRTADVHELGLAQNLAARQFRRALEAH